MDKLSKMSDSELGILYLRVEKTLVAGHYFFEELGYKLREEINKRNRSKIYRVCCRVARNRYHRNQFMVAKDYTDAILNDCNYFENLRSWELRGYETKSGNPYQIDLVCCNC